MRFNETETYHLEKTRSLVDPNMEICQTDYPVDWYQEAFIPYAEE